MSDGDLGSYTELPLEEVWSLNNFHFDALDDVSMHLGGYIEVMQGCADKKYKMLVTTEYIMEDVSTPAPFSFMFPDMCQAFLKKDSWWYEFTKLWTKCPPKTGVSFLLYQICWFDQQLKIGH